MEGLMSSTKSRGRLGPLVTGVTVTCLVLLGVVYYAPGSDSPRGRVLIDLPLGRSFGSHGSNGQCGHYEDVIQEVTTGDSPPILSADQIHWIADEVWAAGQGKGVATNFLVFGLGLDSIMWNKVNCLGRTVFIENYPSWIDKILSIEPGLEVVQVDYNSTVADANKWFQGSAGRWSLDLPSSVDRLCWDVILVDAPQGYKRDMPGRMQSAQLALEKAQRCVSEGRRQKVTVFMHDMERPLEQRIANELYNKERQMYFLGTMDGPGGQLSAWEYSKNVRQPARDASLGTRWATAPAKN